MVERERSKVSGKWKGLKGMGNVKDINEGKMERSKLSGKGKGLKGVGIKKGLK